MKVYLEKTNGGNNLVFVEDGGVKITNCAPSGMFDGVDICAEDAEERLREYFKENAIDFYSDLDGCDDADDPEAVLEELEEMEAVIAFDDDEEEEEEDIEMETVKE